MIMTLAPYHLSRNVMFTNSTLNPPQEDRRTTTATAKNTDRKRKRNRASFHAFLPFLRSDHLTKISDAAGMSSRLSLNQLFQFLPKKTESEHRRKN